MKKQLLSIIALVSVVNATTLAISVYGVLEAIPYALVASSSLYSGYKLYGEKGNRNLQWQEGLPYGALLLATAYGLHNSYAHDNLLNKVLKRAEKAEMNVSLAHLQSSIEEMEKKYSLVRDTQSKDERLALYHTLSTFLRTAPSLGTLEQTLLDDSKKVHIYKHMLIIPTKDGLLTDRLDEKEQAAFNALEKRVFLQAEVLGTIIDKLMSSLCEHKPFLIFECIFKKVMHYDYAEEKHIIENLSEDSISQSNLEKLVNRKYPNATYQFPLLSYGEQLTQAKNELEKALTPLNDYKAFAFDFQKETIAKAQEMVIFLESLLYFVVNTDVYKAQKAQKPLFDRNEEIHKQQLKEQEIILENKRKVAEGELLKRSNQARDLENQRLSLEQSVAQKKLEEQKTKLELEKIRNGQELREALARSDQQWSNKYENLCLQLKKLEQAQLSQAQNGKEEWNSIKNKLKEELTNLEDALEMAPGVQKEDEQSIKNYLNLLKRHLTSAKKSLPL